MSRKVIKTLYTYEYSSSLDMQLEDLIASLVEIQVAGVDAGFTSMRFEADLYGEDGDAYGSYHVYGSRDETKAEEAARVEFERIRSEEAEAHALVVRRATYERLREEFENE